MRVRMPAARLADRLVIKCRGGCKDNGPHTHHLSLYGRWYFSAINPRWWWSS